MRGDRVPMVVTLRALLAAVLSICRNFPGGEAIWLSIPESGTKCISEELHSNVVVFGDYTVVSESHIQTDPTIAVKVTSPYGNILHRTENVTDGQFAFTTREAGSYLACFSMVTNGGFTGAPTSVNVDWKNGITTKDWESVAKREKLEGVEFELKRLEGAVDAIHDNLMHLITREADMRRVSEATNAKVAWLSLFSLGACLAVSTLQVLYLKQFFRRKKLI